MRALECFHALRVLPGTWPVLRLDGRSFSRLTELAFEKPFDSRFHEIMCKTGEALMSELGAVYVYTESDEISVLLPRESNLFDREVEKLISISASVASSTFALAFRSPAQFDSRLWLGTQPELVVEYFCWRQADATRCALNGWAYWTLRKAGQTVGEATAALVGKTVANKNELLFQAGINFNDVPTWQKRGTGLYWETYEKQGFNPKLGQPVSAVRRRVKIDRELPLGEEYGSFILAFLSPSANLRTS
ncbi:MAG TPA: tRNA(His) guanylyltransferase Thg1 family protein [Planctomycetota bacterium]|nr:tRNA(His) guanylyltransferase Thg1 family protein [Planctomycetota bacterium]